MPGIGDDALTVTLRPERNGDEPFLRRLILATLSIELGADAWPEPMRTHLLGIQFAARRQPERAKSPGAASRIIQADGADAGWIASAAISDHIHLAEIMVLPELRGRGIGSAALRVLREEAEELPIRLNVGLANAGAMRLYARMGFRPIGRDGATQYMEWAGPSRTTPS